MRSLRWIRLLPVVAALAVFCGAPARCETLHVRWTDLTTLAAGHDITVSLAHGGSVSGELLWVQADAISMDIHRVSHTFEYKRGIRRVPRTSVTMVHVIRQTGSWGRRIGIILGQTGGVIGGGEFAVHVAKSEGGSAASFLGIYAAATIGGYYLGRKFDRRGFDVDFLPDEVAK